VASSAIPIVALYKGWKKDKTQGKIADTSDEILSDLSFALPVNPYEAFDASAVDREKLPKIDSSISLHSSNGKNLTNTLCQLPENEQGKNKQFNMELVRNVNETTEKSCQTDPVIIKTIQTFKSDKCTRSRSREAGPQYPNTSDYKRSFPSSKTLRLCKLQSRKKHWSFSQKFVPSRSSDLLHDQLFCGTYKAKKLEQASMDNSISSNTDNCSVPAAPTPTEKEIERR
jgi:hypothetical protein